MLSGCCLGTLVNTRFADLLFARCEKELLYYCKLPEAFGANMKVPERCLKL